MTTVQLIAVKHTCLRKPGERFKAPSGWAKALVSRGVAKYADDEPPSPTPRKRRRYKRRDMVPEDNRESTPE